MQNLYHLIKKSIEEYQEFAEEDHTIDQM